MLQFFHKIVDVLTNLKIPYMLSGSVAMSLYVVPRSTRDFDFVVHLAPHNIEKFAANFEDGYYCNINSIKDAIKHQSIFNIIDHASGFKADFVILKNEEYRKVEFERKQSIEFAGKTICVVTKEDLLISKLIWIQQLQSPVQMEDIKNLAMLSEMDETYVTFWVNKLNLKTFNLLSK